MIGELTNHLWQTTVFGLGIALLTLVFRKNRAAVRYALWFAASIKFCIPFSLWMGLGRGVEWAPAAKSSAVHGVSLAMLQLAQPFPKGIPATPAAIGIHIDWVPLILLGVWLCGLAAIVWMRYRGWRRIRAAILGSTPMDFGAAVEVRASPDLLEPGVVGLFRPILLVPEGIVQRLTPLQLQAVLAHEACHVRRRDNVTSTVHMLVEAVFWFHPLVWWIGARLLEERERACDEAVLSQGSQPREYAEGILKICESYLEVPVSCVSGVTGSNLEKRLKVILNGDTPAGLNLARKLALGVAALAALLAPLVVGMLEAPALSALAATVPAPRFISASITPCTAFRGRPLQDVSPGKLDLGCTTVERYIQQAYGLFANGHENPLSTLTVTGGPDWVNSEFFHVEAAAQGNPSQAMMNGPMLQGLLEDRFHLKMHREIRAVPVYDLRVAAGGPKLQPFQGTCIAWDSDNPPADRDPERMCGRGRPTSDGLELNAASMLDLGMFLLVTLDRPILDETGIQGRFDFRMQLPTRYLMNHARGLAALSNPSNPAPPMDPSFVSAVKTEVRKFGLNLEPANGPGEFLLIDRVARPATR